jgi:hypothetical protein
MDKYFGRYKSMTSDFPSSRNYKSPYMYGHMDREEDLYTESYTIPLYNYGVRGEEEFSRETCAKLSQSGHEKDISLYEDEFPWLISEMEKHMPEKDTLEALQRLIQLSDLADEALYEPNQVFDSDLGSCFTEMPSMVNITDLINWQKCQERNRLMFMLQEQAINDRDAELLLLMRKQERLNHLRSAMTGKKAKLENGEYKAEPEYRDVAKYREKKKKEKKPECWHFMRGHCKRGKYCDFSHDSKNGYPDSHKVFLGGLPFQITEASLKQRLLERGFNVVNKPKIYGGFCPQVCLASAAEAKRLIKERTIILDGNDVDIRPYQAFTEKNYEKLLNVNRRSVFLGGLRKGTTTQMIKKELESLGLKVVNRPLVKASFSPQVTMATEKQALILVRMLKVSINGALVDIRPYTAFGLGA